MTPPSGVPFLRTGRLSLLDRGSKSLTCVASYLGRIGADRLQIEDQGRMPEHPMACLTGRGEFMLSSLSSTCVIPLTQVYEMLNMLPNADIDVNVAAASRALSSPPKN